uniref:GNVR domain-containing protein n=1 Tax=Sphingomonas bacterium TaxID=1895847 RepID=UPI0015757B39
DPVAQQLRLDLAAVASQRGQVAVSAGAASSDLRQLDARAAALRGELAQREAIVRQSTTALAARADAVADEENANVAAEKLRLIDAQARGAALTGLRHDVGNAQKAYDRMESRRSALDLMSGFQASHVQVLQPAYPPGRPIWPKPKLLIQAAITFGLLAGAALSLLIESRDRRLRSADDFVTRLGIVDFAPVRALRPSRASIVVHRARERARGALRRLVRRRRREIHG